MSKKPVLVSTPLSHAVK